MHDQTDTTTPALAYELSLAIAFATGAQPNYCYANVWHAIVEHEVLLPGAQLVEGWLVFPQEPHISLIEHCWSEWSGCIVDPSIVLLASRGQPVSYFPGVRRNRAEVQGLACRDFPVVRSVGIYGVDGMGHEYYRAAYTAAYEQANRLAAAFYPSKAIVVHSSLPLQARSPAWEIRIVSSEAFFKEQKQ